MNNTNAAINRMLDYFQQAGFSLSSYDEEAFRRHYLQVSMPPNTADALDRIREWFERVGCDLHGDTPTAPTVARARVAHPDRWNNSLTIIPARVGERTFDGYQFGVSSRESWR